MHLATTLPNTCEIYPELHSYPCYNIYIYIFVLVDEPLVISSSPVKESVGDYWISEYFLYFSDKAILESSHLWINDAIINGIQSTLKRQTKGKLEGWQSTLLVKTPQRLTVLPSWVPFIQVLHVSNNHWVMTTNIKTRTKEIAPPDTVYLYDSNMTMNPSLPDEVSSAICSFLKIKSCKLKVDYVNIQQQENSNDCGAFALACATELALGGNPATCKWDQRTMRHHITTCLESRRMLPFPKCGIRKLSRWNWIRHTAILEIYCICRRPDDGTKMIECISCLKWFHLSCMDLRSRKSYKQMKWSCPECVRLMEDLEK